VFDPPELDERSFVQDVQAKYGFRACFLAAEEFSGRLQLEPRGFQVAPQVLSDGRDALLHLASQAGIRAILAGDVADAYVSGSYLVFDSLLRQGKLRTLQRYWQAYRRATSAPVRRTLLFGCVLPLLPLWLQRELRAAYLRRNLERLRRRLLPGWMPEPLRQELSQRHLELCLEEEHAQRFASPAREHEARLLDPPEVSWHPAPWPVEIWRPYADRRLQEFMLAIPPEQKFAPHPESDEFYAGSKWLVRRAMRGILPESIRTRRAKTVFNGVFEREVARQWPLYEAAFGPSGRSELAVRGYVDPALFWARLQELRDGGGEGADLIYLMQIVALESWLRVFRLPRPQLVTMPPARRVSPRWIEWREGVAALPGRGLSDNR
jgi:asparagine synthase (glutamine-hydrolysing)